LRFWVSSGVLARKPHEFSTRLTVQAETSVPVVTKSCLRPSQKSGCSGLCSHFSAPFRQCNHCSFNFELANYAFNCVTRNIKCLRYIYNIMFLVCEGRLYILLTFWTNFLNVKLNKPNQFRYFMCSSSSTPVATNEALD